MAISVAMMSGEVPEQCRMFDYRTAQVCAISITVSGYLYE